MTEQKPKYLRIVEERMAAKAKAEQQALAEDQVPAEYLDAAPDIADQSEGRDRADEFRDEDQALKSLNILKVYLGITGNKRPDKSGGKDELMIFCPDADHKNNESEAACLNTAKNTWVCYRDGNQGGGIVDMVAASMGLPVGKELKGKDYALAKRETLERFCGWTYTQEGGREVGRSPQAQAAHERAFEARMERNDASHEQEPPALTIVSGVEDDKPDDSRGSASSVSGKQGPVSSTSGDVLEGGDDLSGEVDVLDLPEVLPEISDYAAFVPDDTPLRIWLDTLTKLPVPTEYKLFRGLQLLSIAGGPCLRGNVGGTFKTTLSVLFVGGSGVGKSQSRRAMDVVLDDPTFRWSSVTGVPFGTHSYNGTKSIPDPGSGEFLLKHLSRYEPSDGSAGYSVRDVMALVEYDEFAQFMAKANTKNGSLMTVFQQFDNSPTLDGKIEVGSLSGGTHRAINANVIFSTSVQPKALGKVIGKHNIDNGFLARFEVVTGNRVIAASYKDEAIPNLQHAQAAYKGVAKYYQEKAYPTNDRTARPELVMVDLSSDAEAEFEEYWTYLQHSRDTDIKSRFDLKFKKLCTLFAINSLHDQIEVDDVRAARWVMEYLNRSAEITEQKTGSTDEIELEHALINSVATICAREDYATVSKVANAIRAKARGWDKERITKKLDEFVRQGELEIDPRRPARGAAVTRYVYMGSLSEAKLKIVKDEQRKAKKTTMRNTTKGTK